MSLLQRAGLPHVLSITGSLMAGLLGSDPI